MISEVEYKILDLDIRKLSKSYFYKSTLAFSERYHNEFSDLEMKLMQARDKALSEINGIDSTMIKNALIGLSSLKDHAILIV